MDELGRRHQVPGLVRKAMYEGRASTDDDYGSILDATPDEHEKRLAHIAELEEQITDLPASEHKVALVAELRKLKREAAAS